MPMEDLWVLTLIYSDLVIQAWWLQVLKIQPNHLKVSQWIVKEIRLSTWISLRSCKTLLCHHLLHFSTSSVLILSPVTAPHRSLFTLRTRSLFPFNLDCRISLHSKKWNWDLDPFDHIKNEFYSISVDWKPKMREHLNHFLYLTPTIKISSCVDYAQE